MINELTINHIKIELKKDYAIFQDVDLVFNSASGLLLMRTGTAKVIRKHSEKLNPEEKKEYFKLLNSFSNPIIKKYIEVNAVRKWEPKQAQLSSFKRIIENNGPYKAGDIIIDKEWSKKDSKHVLHVVGMTYHLTNGELDINKTTEELLIKVLKKAFQFADNHKYKSISVPVLCTRGNYGLNPKVILRTILKAIKETKSNFIKKIIICFESKGPRKAFDFLTQENLKEESIRIK